MEIELVVRTFPVLFSGNNYSQPQSSKYSLASDLFLAVSLVRLLELSEATDLDSRILAAARTKAFSVVPAFTLVLGLFPFDLLFLTSFLLYLILLKSHYECWYILMYHYNIII